jgi:predicted NAD/FAD-dependent oxidoreductase
VVHDTLIVGAGIAGLALARELTARGQTPVVLERANGVGGRCATRRVDGQPVDHGLAFLHGRTPHFLAAVAAARDAAAITHWPRHRDGDGVPCQPQAFDPLDTRVAPAGGVNVLAKHLAQGADVRLGARVEALALEPATPDAVTRVWTVTLAGGDRLQSRSLVLALPAPSTLGLLATIAPQEPAIAPLLPLLRLIHVVPCLAVIARYPQGTPPPAWEASYPADGSAVHAVLHDSTKRPGAPRLTLVIQGRPGFSQKHVDTPEDQWAQALLDEAATLHGGWIRTPDLLQPHRWRYARVAIGTELAAPLVAHCEGGAVLGLAGDGLHAAGGVEGAYLSGVALAARLTGSTPARA